MYNYVMSISKDLDNAISEELSQHITIMEPEMSKGNKPPKNDKSNKKPKKEKLLQIKDK